MSQSEVLSHFEMPSNTGVEFYCADNVALPQMAQMQANSDFAISDDEPMPSVNQPEHHQTVQQSFTAADLASSHKPIVDGDGHVCTKASVNPFFNLLRLYRSLPESKGKSAPQLAIEGARIWRAMTPVEKDPFQRSALKESRRRLNSRQKRSKPTNDTKSRDRRSYTRRSKEPTTTTTTTKGSSRKH